MSLCALSCSMCWLSPPPMPPPPPSPSPSPSPCTDLDDAGARDVDGDGCSYYYGHEEWCGGGYCMMTTTSPQTPCTAPAGGGEFDSWHALVRDCATDRDRRRMRGCWVIHFRAFLWQTV